MDDAMLGHPKPRPHALVKRERKAAVSTQDRAENRNVRLRSDGRCEVVERFEHNYSDLLANLIFPCRCSRMATGTPHHLIGGFGRRNIGKSILAQWKLAVCRRCHDEITRHILVPLDPRADALRIVYRRVR